MKETARISKLFEDLYEGSPWIDVNIASTLKNISAQQASKKVAPGRNSIWEIVNHLVSWRMDVLQRIQGKVIKSPAHNYIVPVKDVSDKAWKNMLKQLDDSQQQWISILNDFNEKDFARVYPGNKMTYYEHIHGILQHDAYHLGQVVLLSKIV